MSTPTAPAGPDPARPALPGAGSGEQVHVGELRGQVAPLVNRPAPAVAARVVGSADRSDEVVWEQIRRQCTALDRLDTTFAEAFGAPGLAADLWMAAYAHDPHLREIPREIPGREISREIPGREISREIPGGVGARRSARAVVSAMLGTPEHTELRTSTVGDPYIAAMAVLAQAPALKRMLRELDPSRRAQKAHRHHQHAATAIDTLEEAFRRAEHAAEHAEHDLSEQEISGEPGDDDPADDGGATDPAAGGAGSGAGGGRGSSAASGSGADTDLDTGELDIDELDVEEGDGLAELDGLVVPDAQVAAVASALAAVEAADAAAAGAGEARVPDAGVLAGVRAAAREACAQACDEVEGEMAAMAAWGVGAGERELMDPDARMRLAARFTSGKLRAFAQLIGRFRQLGQAQRARRVEHARGEYVGVTLGDDLTSLLPAELVNLAVPALRAQFAIRYAEAQLMVYDQRGDEHEGQGAVIVCIDCSDSMLLTDNSTDLDDIDDPYRPGRGITGEAYAKALALALLDQARTATPVREFAAILFSHHIDETFIFPANAPVELEQRIRLAETFPGGGTSFTAPLDAALALVEAEYNTTGRQRADVVLLTDGVAGLPPEWLARWHERKTALGFRAFAVQIGAWADDRAAEVLASCCDDVRHINDLTDTHATADIFRAV